MEKTYTYTARSAEHPERVVTFTLHDSRLSVEMGAPLEQIEIALQRGGEDAEEELEGKPADELEIEQEPQPKLWLRPLAVSLVERGTRPVHVDDVDVRAVDDWLRVRAWVRAGGLRLAPITLIEGRVDNPDAAHAFADEVEERKTAAGLNLLSLLDYWATWFVAGFSMLVLLQVWRRRESDKE